MGCNTRRGPTPSTKHKACEATLQDAGPWFGSVRGMHGARRPTNTSNPGLHAQTFCSTHFSMDRTQVHPGPQAASLAAGGRHHKPI